MLALVRIGSCCMENINVIILVLNMSLGAFLLHTYMENFVILDHPFHNIF